MLSYIRDLLMSDFIERVVKYDMGTYIQHVHISCKYIQMCLCRCVCICIKMHRHTASKIEEHIIPNLYFSLDIGTC